MTINDREVTKRTLKTRSTFSKILERCLPVLLIVSLVFLSACDTEGSSGVGTVITDLAREQLSFSVLAINLQGIEEHYGPQSVFWPVRYSRIADWMKVNKTFPDFIALQEVHGQSTSNNQYQVLHTLLNQIKAQTTISYRVAYLAVNPIPFPGSTLWQGLALLYNADRLTNITAISTLNVSNYGDLKTGFHKRKSLPCQASHPTFNGLCSLIDGDGVSWISSTIRSSNGRWVTGPVLARFELKDAPGLPIHIYNVHAPLSNESNSHIDKMEFLAQFKDLTSNIESALGSNRLYPPIVLGDFNLDVGRVISDPTGYGTEGFEIAGFANREVMGVLVGRQDTFPSKQRAYARTLVVPVDVEEPSTGGSCGNIDQLWSDHCGVFVQFSPVP